MGINNELDIDVAMIFIRNEGYFARKLSGETIAWPHSIRATIGLLPEDQFFRIRSGCIVNRDCIRSVRRTGKTGVVVCLKVPFDEMLKVSHRNAVKFKRWWQRSTN